jgi:hypothetical protein
MAAGEEQEDCEEEFVEEKLELIPTSPKSSLYSPFLAGNTTC